MDAALRRDRHRHPVRWGIETMQKLSSAFKVLHTNLTLWVASGRMYPFLTLGVKEGIAEKIEVVKHINNGLNYLDLSRKF